MAKPDLSFEQRAYLALLANPLALEQAHALVRAGDRPSVPEALELLAAPHVERLRRLPRG
jgi:hypothetical protein